MKTKMKNLVIATDNFLPRRDGITRFVSTLLPKLKENFNITLICPTFEEEFDILEEVKVVKIPYMPFFIGDFKPSKLSFKKIKTAIKDADLIFIQTLGPIGGLTTYYAKKENKKLLGFMHSVEWKLVPRALGYVVLTKLTLPLVKIIIKWIYKKFNTIIVPSDSTAEILALEKVFVATKTIHLGIDTKKFIPYFENESRKIIRETYGFKTTDIVIGYHGRIAHEKDLKTLVRAFISLKKKHPRIHLLLVGDGIPSLIEKLASKEGVVHIPAVENVQNFVAAMDIYCLPSLTETTSLSTLEAMSCSLPIVTTGSGFIKEYMQKGKNGFLFHKKDSFELRKKLERLCKNKVMRKEFGKKSREIVILDFQWETTEKKLIKFINEFAREDIK